MIEKIPGRLNDRKTPLGELNWIFTAVTDTIAWNVLPSGTSFNFPLYFSNCPEYRCVPETLPAGFISGELVQKLPAGRANLALC